MEFTTKELAVLNQMISIALLSGQIEFSEETKSVYQKVTDEILHRESDSRLLRSIYRVLLRIVYQTGCPIKRTSGR